MSATEMIEGGYLAELMERAAALNMEVRISPAGGIIMRPAGGGTPAPKEEPAPKTPLSPAERQRRSRERRRGTVTDVTKNVTSSKGNVTEIVTPNGETVTNVTAVTESVTPPSPPPSLPPAPPIPPAPTPMPVQGAQAGACEERHELFEVPKPPHKRIFWAPAAGFTGILPMDRDDWAKAFPACDIDRQLSAASQWLKANPAKARKKNFFRFLCNWLERQQERGGDIPSNQSHGNHRRGAAKPPVTRNAEPVPAGAPSLNATAVNARQSPRLETVRGSGADEDGDHDW